MDRIRKVRKIEPKKGLIITSNDMYYLNTGRHTYVGSYNFYNRPGSGSIGVVKSFENSSSNNIIWTPNTNIGGIRSISTQKLNNSPELPNDDETIGEIINSKKTIIWSGGIFVGRPPVYDFYEIKTFPFIGSYYPTWYELIYYRIMLIGIEFVRVPQNYNWSLLFGLLTGIFLETQGYCGESFYYRRVTCGSFGINVLYFYAKGVNIPFDIDFYQTYGCQRVLGNMIYSPLAFSYPVVCSQPESVRRCFPIIDCPPKSSFVMSNIYNVGNDYINYQFQQSYIQHSLHVVIGRVAPRTICGGIQPPQIARESVCPGFDSIYSDEPIIAKLYYKSNFIGWTLT